MSNPLYTLFTLSIIFITCYADDHTNTSLALCSTSQCGDLSISYPFWTLSHTSNTSEFCGYPDFGLECSKEGKAIITLPSDIYYVTDINYDNQSITLVDIDILDQECPRARNNVTRLANSNINIPLSFSPLDLNLSFYFNCSSYPQFVDPIECWGGSNSNDTRKSYVFVEGEENDGGFVDWNCEQHVVVVVKDDEIDISSNGGLIEEFGGAMKKGFVLDWRRDKECGQCEVSGGYCGYDQESDKFLCICGNGSVVASSCKKEYGMEEIDKW